MKLSLPFLTRIPRNFWLWSKRRLGLFVIRCNLLTIFWYSTFWICIDFSSCLVRPSTLTSYQLLSTRSENPRIWQSLAKILVANTMKWSNLYLLLRPNVFWILANFGKFWVSTTHILCCLLPVVRLDSGQFSCLSFLNEPFLSDNVLLAV